MQFSSSTDLAALAAAVTRFRRALEAYSRRGDDEFARIFPRDWCKTASMLLARYLDEEGLGRAALVANAERASASGGTQIHAWLRMHGHDIDTTADQFDGETRGVVIEPAGTIHRGFSEGYAFPWDRYMNHADRYRDDLFDPWYQELVALVDTSSHPHSTGE